MTSQGHHHWVVYLICATSLAGCVVPTPGDDGADDGADESDSTGGDDDTTGDGDGDTNDDGDGDPGDDEGDGDPNGEGDPSDDGVPYRTAGVLWNEVGRIKLALYDRELGWEEPMDVNQPEHHAVDSVPTFVGAIDDTGVTVMWDHYIDGVTPMSARRYHQDLGWENPVAIDPNTPYRFAKDLIALPDGQALAVWQQSPTLHNGTYTVAYSCRDAQGVWGTVEPSDNPNIQVQRRQDGTLVVFDVDIEAPQIVAQVFDQGGGTEWCSQPLDDATKLNPTFDRIRMVPIRDRGGPLIHAVWRSDGTRQVETARFDPETLTWSATTLLPSLVDYPSSHTGDTILGAEDRHGNLWLVANDASTDNMRLRVHRYDSDLQTWSDTSLLDQPDHELYFPALAVSPERDVFVAAQIEATDVDEPRQVVGFAWNAAEHTWSEPIELGTTSESQSNTLVEIEPDSRDVFVAWTHDNDAHLMHFDAQAQTWSEQVFPTDLDQHSVRYLRAIGNGEVLLIRQDSTLDFPNSISTITASVHDGGGWGADEVLASNTNVGVIRPFVAEP